MVTRMLRCVFALHLLALAGTCQTRTYTLQPDVEYQVIENFGASDCWSMQKLGAWSAASKEKVADLLFSQTKGAGLSCWRFNVGGGVNPQITNPWRTAETFEIAEGKYDWTRQAGERWFLKAAKARGVPQFLAFVNSPPGRMTRNGLTFCDKGEATTNLKPGFEGRYARYLADILDHFRKNPDAAERIFFNFVSPVNEPNGAWEGHSQEGNRASNADIKAITRALASELKARKIPTDIALVESAGLPPMYSLVENMTKQHGADYGNYLDELVGDRSISPLLNGRIGYHSYGSDRLETKFVPNRQALKRKFDQYPGWKIWMTEYCVMEGPEGKGGGRRDLTMAAALDVARVIHADLTMVGVSAWQWWTAVSNVRYLDGLIYTDYRNPGDAETIYPARLLWVMGNFSRFVRPGMKRIGVSGPEDDIRGLMRSAYKDERGRRIVSVYVNVGEQPQTVTQAVDPGQRNWRLKSLTPYVTSDREGDELKAYPPVEAGKPFEIPPRSVVTFVAQL
jgi:O-glycosyl hydrolase